MALQPTKKSSPDYTIIPRRPRKGGRPRKKPKGWQQYNVGDVVLGRKVIKVLNHSTQKKKQRYRLRFMKCGHEVEMSHSALDTANKNGDPGRKNSGYCPNICLKKQEVIEVLPEPEHRQIPEIRTRPPASDPGGHWLGWIVR